MPERGSKTLTVPVVWVNFGIFSTRSKWFPVGHDWWPWTKPGYITMSRRQSNNQWSGGIAAHHTPKIPSAKFRWKISRLDFLGSRRHPPHWLSSKGPNYQCGVLLISAGAIEVHFEGKTPQEVHQGSLVLARQCPGSLGTCNPEETDLPGLPLSFFVRRGVHCCRGERVGLTTYWIFFFWVACKS